MTISIDDLTGNRYAIPPQETASELGKVEVLHSGDQLVVQFTVRIRPQGDQAEGWQTGLAMDGSASMREWYGKAMKGKIPPEVLADYQQKGWVQTRIEDGKRVAALAREAKDDVRKNGYFAPSVNLIQPIACASISLLAGELDADGGTTVIYWACGNGSAIEVLGDFTQEQCATLELNGPRGVPFGTGTQLAPAVKYFEERFREAKRGMYLFLTDGRIEDLEDVKALTVSLAKQIEAGARNPVKCVLIGIGNQIDEAQMIELDDLDTDTEVDIWDHKIGLEPKDIELIFSEVVDENQIVAPEGTIFDSSDNKVAYFSDGLPAKVSFRMSDQCEWFELHAGGLRVRQSVKQAKV